MSGKETSYLDDDIRMRAWIMMHEFGFIAALKWANSEFGKKAALELQQEWLDTLEKYHDTPWRR